ncbi:hypothetical protein R1flu_009246 [Riccia fluitans]|uniref:Uncharacterized protein n=1 Tax=Riccia fluitans TaxID=41844 RepID=A0ABD1Z426_9MARC
MVDWVAQAVAMCYTEQVKLAGKVHAYEVLVHENGMTLSTKEDFNFLRAVTVGAFQNGGIGSKSISKGCTSSGNTRVPHQFLSGCWVQIGRQRKMVSFRGMSEAPKMLSKSGKTRRRPLIHPTFEMSFHSLAFSDSKLESSIATNFFWTLTLMWVSALEHG